MLAAKVREQTQETEAGTGNHCIMIRKAGAVVGLLFAAEPAESDGSRCNLHVLCEFLVCANSQLMHTNPAAALYLLVT